MPKICLGVFIVSHFYIKKNDEKLTKVWKTRFSDDCFVRK